MRAVFFGTPEFAVPTLQALLTAHEVPLVVTQPDRPAGRGMEMRRSPVAVAADAARVDVLQPPRGGDADVIERVREAAADVLVVAAYGRLLPPDLLGAAREGGLNVHASLLPRWRGAAPIAAAILAGDAETGVSIMRMDAGLDTGPVLLQRAVAIAPDETAATLTRILGELGADALIEGLRQVDAGTASFSPQPEDGATYAPAIRKGEGDIGWDLSGADIERLIRAFDPWPGVRLPIAGQSVRVLAGSPLPAWAAADASESGAGSEPGRGAEPGAVLGVGPTGIEVMAADAPFVIKTVQPPGKRPMAAAEYARGRRDLTPTGG